jgi:endonuclease III
MLDHEQLAKITAELIAFGKTVPKESLLPTVVPEAASLVVTDPYAFAIATCLDRGMKAEIIWTIPYDIKNDLGHLDPRRIFQMTLDELDSLFKRLPRQPRYRGAATKTLRDLTRIIVEKFDGDASKIWKDKTAEEATNTLDSIYGVGPGIASMGALLIEKAFDVRFRDRESMDIKPDVHTVRVLYRLGASQSPTVESAIKTSRQMNPSFPGEIDGGLWEIGRRWCFASGPDCPHCPMTLLCSKRFDEEAPEGLGTYTAIKEISAVEAIKRRFGTEGRQVEIPLQKGQPFVASMTVAGVIVDDLGAQSLLPWIVFEEAINILSRNGGRAERGDAMNSKLGDKGLPLDSIEGHIAHEVYGKQIGESIFRRISPIAAILIWAGVCESVPGELILRQR